MEPVGSTIAARVRGTPKPDEALETQAFHTFQVKRPDGTTVDQLAQDQARPASCSNQRRKISSRGSFRLEAGYTRQYDESLLNG